MLHRVVCRASTPPPLLSRVLRRRVGTDIAIAQAATLQRITRVAKERLGLDDEHLEPYGHFKAKVSLQHLDTLADRPEGKLVLVTAMSPTPAGEGKTLTTVGLGDALNRIGKRAAIAVREPSLGPVFGIKGGAAGGGYSQVVPMEDINLHFTGDFAAIGLAHSLLAAMLDNHIHHGNELGIDVRRIQLKRVVDMNDRALRETTVALGGVSNGYPRQDGFDIVVASEVMAVFCLATSLDDLKQRLGSIVVGYTRSPERRPVTARDLNAHGAMTVLLKDALAPNLVQTLENNPAFVHGGPFANIAHGCNSVIATRAALRLADYVVTEAGFGADLGAEKFVDIKCRKSGLRPAAAVVVATVRACKYHGGADAKRLTDEDLEALGRGVVNLERHVENVSEHYGLNTVVSINRFASDTDAELELLRARVEALGVPVVVSDGWAEGSRGVVPLAEAVLEQCARPSRFRYVYDDSDPLIAKVEKIARTVYRASAVTFDPKVRAQLRKLTDDGHGGLPVCVAKTQSSFSTDASLRGAPAEHVVNVREVRLAAGAEFVVMICGDMLTMPGLPKVPSACNIDLKDGKVVGLF